jgi:hypothetical protein
VRRLRDLDPRGERTRWRKCSEIATYACAREMAEVSLQGNAIHLDLPVLCKELTLRITDVEAADVVVEGTPLRAAPSRAAFESGTFLREGEATLVAFDPPSRRPVVVVSRR